MTVATSGVQTVLGDRLYFAADGDTELWMYDPVRPDAGTIKVAEINPESGSNAHDLAALGDKLYFFADGPKIWAYEPSTGATFVAEPGADTGGGGYADQLTALGGKLFELR